MRLAAKIEAPKLAATGVRAVMGTRTSHAPMYRVAIGRTGVTCPASTNRSTSETGTEMANPYEVRVQYSPAIRVMKMVAKGTSRLGVFDSSASGAMLSTPAIDRKAKIEAVGMPARPFGAAPGSNGGAVKPASP